VSHRSSWRSVKVWSVLLLGASTFAFAVFVLVRQPPEVNADASYSAPSPKPRTVSLWLGDSYTAGTGADSLHSGEACLTAAKLDWLCKVDAQGGTGFLADGHINSSKFKPLRGRLRATAAKYEADIVVIDAGRNDGSAAEEDLRAAVASYVEDVHGAWPRAKIVAISPYFVSSRSRPLGDWFVNFERDVVERYEGIFIDPIEDGWAGQRDGLTLPDGVHPNQAGHEYIAEHLSRTLKPLTQ